MPVEIEALALFALASAAIVIVPGPTVTVIVANSLSTGSRAGLMNVAGTQLGLASMLLLLAVGFGSLVDQMGQVFEWVRLAGAAYLIWLGITLWRADGASLDVSSGGAEQSRSDGFYIRQGFLVIWANPKALVFFGAFIPQFVDVSRSAVPQLLLLGAVFMIVGALFDGIYALAAGRARHWLTRAHAQVAERIASVFLILGGIWLALSGSASADSMP